MSYEVERIKARHAEAQRLGESYFEECLKADDHAAVAKARDEYFHALIRLEGALRVLVPLLEREAA